MAGLGGIFSGINFGSLIKSVGIGAVVLVIVGALVIWGFFWFKKKMTYKTPVSLIMVMANGSHKRRDDILGGQVKGRNGVQDFVCSIPKVMKPKRLGFVPDYSLADGLGRLVFITRGDGMIWQQCQEKVVTDKEIEFEVKKTDGSMEKKKVTASLLIEPIPTDVKTITINNIHAVENIMESNRLKAAAIVVGGFILMVFVQIIFLFLTSKR